MPIIENGIRLIKEFESCKLEAYKCPAGIWTIGYGHTGSDVKKGKVITQAQAEKLLLDDISSFSTRIHNLLIKKRVRRSVTPSQFAALTSLAFNIGFAALRDSTVMKMISGLSFDRAAEAFLLWDKVRNPETKLLEVSAGLARRRQAEKALFLNT